MHDNKKRALNLFFPFLVCKVFMLLIFFYNYLTHWVLVCSFQSMKKNLNFFNNSLKVLISLSALFVSFHSFALVCREPTQEEKEAVYGFFNIPLSVHIPLKKECEDFRKTIALENVNEQGSLHKTFLVKTACTGGCILAGLIWLGTPSTDEIIADLRRDYPLERVKGRRVPYNFGGGHFEYYYIKNRSDYDYMISDIRSKTSSKIGQNIDTVAYSLCFCGIQVFF